METLGIFQLFKQTTYVTIRKVLIFHSDTEIFII